MSNGPMCCYIRACCTENEQREALAKKVADHFGWTGDEKVGAPTDNALAVEVANFVLDHFDLVPRGVGAAIAEGYKPLFKERLRQ